MTLAAVHLSPAITIPAAIAVAVALGFYWWRLRGAEVPPSRRKIRRVSIALMLFSLPMFVRGLSYVDPKVQWREYLLTWMTIIVLVVLVAISAVLDAANNLRLHRRMRREHIEQATESLAREITARRRARKPPHTGPNGERKDA